MQVNSCPFQMMANRHPQTPVSNKAPVLITINNNICMTPYTPRPWRMGFVVFGIRKLRHRGVIWAALQLYLSSTSTNQATRGIRESFAGRYKLIVEQIETAQLWLACLTQPGMFSKKRAQAEHYAQEYEQLLFLSKHWNSNPVYACSKSKNKIGEKSLFPLSLFKEMLNLQAFQPVVVSSGSWD